MAAPVRFETQAIATTPNQLVGPRFARKPHKKTPGSAPATKILRWQRVGFRWRPAGWRYARGASGVEKGYKRQGG